MTNDELSAEVARRLFGVAKPRRGVDRLAAITPFASDHNAAMGLVVPEMRKRGFVWFDCGIDKLGIAWAKFNPWGGLRGYSNGDELPRAICEAALAALDADTSLPPIHKLGDPGYRFAYTPEAKDD